MLVTYSEPPGVGWYPITHMARLAADHFGAELVVLPDVAADTSRWRRALELVPRLPGEPCLVIAPQPVHLRALAYLPFRRLGPVAGWVIDSFWLDRIPKAAARYDHLWVTDCEDVDAWRRATGVPTGWLPWGADVAGLGSANPNRPVDLLRLGRQPASWDDDDETARLAEGLRFTGRPPLSDRPATGHRALLTSLAQAKFTLSFTNRVSPASYTHPTREYLTGRWTDALAAGATVAGIPPRTASTHDLLWPGATLDIGTTDRAAGLAMIREAVADWTPEIAARNRDEALRRLDWRLRFAQIATALTG